MAETVESATDWLLRYRQWGLPAHSTGTGVALVTDDWTTVASLPSGLAHTVDTPPGPILARRDGPVRWSFFTWLDTPVAQRHATILARAGVRLSPVGTVVALPSDPGRVRAYWVRHPGHHLPPTSAILAPALCLLTDSRGRRGSGLYARATRCAGAASGDSTGNDLAQSRVKSNRGTP